MIPRALNDNSCALGSISRCLLPMDNHILRLEGKLSGYQKSISLNLRLLCERLT